VSEVQATTLSPGVPNPEPARALAAPTRACAQCGRAAVHRSRAMPAPPSLRIRFERLSWREPRAPKTTASFSDIQHATRHRRSRRYTMPHRRQLSEIARLRVRRALRTGHLAGVLFDALQPRFRFSIRHNQRRIGIHRPPALTGPSTLSSHARHGRYVQCAYRRGITQ